jgi:hypothetical protein
MIFLALEAKTPATVVDVLFNYYDSHFRHLMRGRPTLAASFGAQSLNTLRLSD